MDKLPPEILLCILSYLDQKFLARYTTVCRGFQFWLETRTFAKIKKRIDNLQQLEEFDAIFSSARRCYLPQLVRFRIWLPVEPNKSIKDYEPLNVLRYRHFTKIICGIFKILQKWNIARGQNEKRPFHLSIKGIPGNSVSYNDVRGRHKHVGFCEFQVLPSLSFITSFRVEGIDILPSTMKMIFEALPHLEDVNWEICTPRRPFNDLRTSLRESLATTLLETNFSHLVSLKIALCDMSRLDGDFETENHVGLDGNDRLSLAVNRIIKLPNLEILELQGVFVLSPAIFDLEDEHGSISETLKDLHFHLSTVTPDGRRYFNADRGAGTAVDARWGLPNLPGLPRLVPTTFDPFLVAMARGITKMPALESFYCCFHDAAYVSCFAPIDRSKTLSSFLPPTGWIIQFESAELFTAPPNSYQPVDWDLPSEFTQILRAAGHRVLIIRGGDFY